MLRVLRPTVLLSLIIVTASLSAFAQSNISVQGTVTDTSGAVIPGTLVEAFVAGRAIDSSASGADGRYSLDVPPGVPVELRLHREGFAGQSVRMAGLSAQTTRNVTLRIGSLSDTVVVTATRGAQSRAAVTESLTAFSRADLESLASPMLADVLQYVPGVHVASTGREGSVASMFSRGGESDYNLVLIDGVRVNQSGGIFDFSRINSADIDRLEVVRGAQSALWGSDAMGSVVQIFTRRARAGDAIHATGSLEGGTFGAFRGDGQIGGSIGQNADYSAGVSRRSSDGAFSSILPERDRFEQTGVHLAAGGSLSPRLSVRGGVRYTTASGRSVGQIAYGARDTGTAYDTRDVTGHVDVSHSLGSRYSGTAAINSFHYRSASADTVADPGFFTYAILEGRPNAIFPGGSRLVRLVDAAEFATLAAAGAAPAPGQFLASRLSSDFPFTSAVQLRRPAIRYQGDYAWDGHRLSAGYDWERERNPLVAGFALTNHAAFVQQHLAIRDRWFATIGARVDRKEGYDTFLSPKLSTGGHLVPFKSGAVSSVKVFANLGRGIKSPTFGERFGGSFADPAPDLKVERARTADVGIEATFADQRFRAMATYFNNDFTDQIAFRSGLAGDGIPEYINIDGSRADGWELEGALRRAIAGFTASASLAVIDHRVVTNLSTSQQFQPGQPLLRRPRHAGSVRAAYTHGRVTVSFDARLVGDRHDHSFLSLRTVPNADRPTAVTTDITVNPGYRVMGASIDVHAHDAVTLFLRADNLGDAAYESVLGYPGLPRAVVAGARFTLGARR